MKKQIKKAIKAVDSQIEAYGVSRMQHIDLLFLIFPIYLDMDFSGNWGRTAGMQSNWKED